MKKNSIYLCFIVLGVCGALFFIRPNTFEHRSQLLLGTVCEITLSGETQELRDKAFSDAFEVIKMIEEQLSVFSPTSELSEVNAYAYVSDVMISPELYEVVKKSIEISDLTHGAFDITTYPLCKLWKSRLETENVPSLKEIEEIKKNIGYDKIQLVGETCDGTVCTSSKIQYLQEGLLMDLGGIAKGYACDKVVESLKANSITKGLVNVGGTLYAFGKSPHNKPWVIGIRNPREKEKNVLSVTLDDRAVATSGNYEQFMTVNGKHYTHIIDPRSGYPVEDVVSVTVIAATAMEADGLSTGFFVLGAEEGIALANTIPQIETLIIRENNGSFDSFKSDGFSKFEV